MAFGIDTNGHLFYLFTLIMYHIRCMQKITVLRLMLFVMMVLWHFLVHIGGVYYVGK